MCVWRLRATTNARRIRRAARPLAAPSGFALRAQATRRLRRGRISLLETVRRRRGLKVAIPVRFIFSFTVHRCAPFARRRRTVSTFGLRQMPATRKPPTRYTKAHKISRINELPPQKGIFRVISCRALGPCSCPADGAPAGGGGGGATGEASPQAMSRRHCRMLPQGNATFAGFVVARSAPPSYVFA